MARTASAVAIFDDIAFPTPASSPAGFVGGALHTSSPLIVPEPARSRRAGPWSGSSAAVEGIERSAQRTPISLVRCCITAASGKPTTLSSASPYLSQLSDRRRRSTSAPGTIDHARPHQPCKAAGCAGRKLGDRFWPGLSCGEPVLVEQSAQTLSASDPVDLSRERDHVRFVFGSTQKHSVALVAAPGVVMGDVDVEHVV